MPIEDPLATELSAYAKGQAPRALDTEAVSEIDQLAHRAAGRLREEDQAEDPNSLAETRRSLLKIVEAATPADDEGAGFSRLPSPISGLDVKMAIQGLCPGLYPFC